MEKAPFVADRAILRRPGLDDQVERFPVPLVHPNRIAIGRRDLPWHAPHEADLDAAARMTSASAISSATRTGCRRLAIGLPRIRSRAFLVRRAKRGKYERRGGINAGGGLMMLVKHHLDAFIVSDAPFVQIAVPQSRAFFRIVVLIRQRHPDGVVGVDRRQVGVSRLTEVPSLHS